MDPGHIDSGAAIGLETLLVDTHLGIACATAAMKPVRACKRAQVPRRADISRNMHYVVGAGGTA
eukprot:6663090-Pyramimonas_sp.AAC.1